MSKYRIVKFVKTFEDNHTSTEFVIEKKNPCWCIFNKWSHLKTNILRNFNELSHYKHAVTFEHWELKTDYTLLDLIDDIQKAEKYPEVKLALDWKNIPSWLINSKKFDDLDDAINECKSLKVKSIKSITLY